MEPEAAWRRVVEEIQKIPNVADRATAAEEIFGGTSEKLAGIINLTSEEFCRPRKERLGNGRHHGSRRAR